MTLLECQERVTHREYLVWMAHFDLERERPSRADLYAMQIAAEIRRSYVKRPGDVELHHMLLVFAKPKEEAEEEARPEGWLEKSKNLWAGMFGIVRKKQE